jgi:hypothetical protein
VARREKELQEKLGQEHTSGYFHVGNPFLSFLFWLLLLPYLQDETMGSTMGTRDTGGGGLSGCRLTFFFATSCIQYGMGGTLTLP